MNQENINNIISENSNLNYTQENYFNSQSTSCDSISRPVIFKKTTCLFFQCTRGYIK